MCRGIILITIILTSLSCARVLGQRGEITTTSPGGLYEVKIEVRKVPAETTRGYTEYGKFTALKEHQIIHTYEWRNSEEFEPSFLESHPRQEWVSETTIRLGEDRSDQPFLDELTVINDTSEPIKYVELSYGKTEMFWIFDVAAGKRVKVKASARVKRDIAILSDSVGFGGETATGRNFTGVVKAEQRKSEDGPVQLQIVINDSILKY